MKFGEPHRCAWMVYNGIPFPADHKLYQGFTRCSCPQFLICVGILLACHIATCIDWKPVIKYSVTTWHFPCYSVCVIYDSSLWYSPKLGLLHKHIGTQNLRPKFAVKSYEDGEKFWPWHWVFFFLSNEGEFKFSTHMHYIFMKLEIVQNVNIYMFPTWFLKQIEGFHMTSCQANFAGHHTPECHVGFLWPQAGMGKYNKMSLNF